MKKIKYIMFGLLLVIFLTPYMALGQAANKPAYVGINENQRIIWTTEFDKGPLENFYEDRGDSKSDAEDFASATFDQFRWDEKVEAWKVYIYDIRPESKEDVYLPYESFDEKCNRVKYIYSLYQTKDITDDSNWKKIEKLESGKIWEPNEELFYKDLFTFTLGIDSSEHEHWYPALIIPKDLDYKEIADMASDDVEDTPGEDYLSADDIKVQYFASQKSVGIQTEYDPVLDYPAYKSDLDTFKSFAKWDDNGVLYYYEWTYGGKTIVKYELLGIFGINQGYVIENWWWLALIGGAIAVGVVILIVVIIKIKRK